MKWMDKLSIYTISHKCMDTKEWIINVLQNACKKKNILYKEFIKYRSIKAKQKYKQHKNKLTNIMRICKEEYYSSLLDGNNNIKRLEYIRNSSSWQQLLTSLSFIMTKRSTAVVVAISPELKISFGLIIIVTITIIMIITYC